MEDIYDDLNNYEDVNALQELRDENRKLKVKLEEHSAAMEKLQKDYDILDMEFKKLQNNYSSLLMTARSEVQRKTQRITQLNTEKDLMVLNSLKSGKDIRRNLYEGVKNPGRMNYGRLSRRGNNKNNDDNIKQKNDDNKHERREAPVLLPKNADTNSGTCNRNKSDYAGVKVELSNNRRNSGYENIAEHNTEHNEPSKTAARSIKDRRKSVPAVRIPMDAFSSDEELGRNYQTKDTRTEHLRSGNERNNINKILIDRNSNKTSEASSVDDRWHNNPESTLKDNYKGRSSRHHDSSMYRGRDKYEISLKYRQQYSPERRQTRQHRDLKDHRHEREWYQGRSLESPPPESYNRNQLSKSDLRSDYDRYFHDRDKNRYQHDSKYSSKYRSKDYDEPHSKRQRIESYGKSDAKEGRKHYHERESMDEAAPNLSPHEYDLLRFSCQSPDFVHTDAALANPIKEIMATAAIPLEDPRVTSKRYVIWKENGIETLSTALGRNVYIKPVNKAVWDIKPVDIPVALVRRPSQCSDTVAILDLSRESGEVREPDDEIHVIRSKLKQIQHNTQDVKISKQVPEDLLKQATDIEKVSKPDLPKYRIPKIGQNDKKTHSKMDVPVIDVDRNVPHHKNLYRKGAAKEEDSIPKELITHNQQYNEREERVNVKDFLPDHKSYSKIEGHRKSRSRERGENQNQTTLTKLAIVADDLELSDDNSDHMDTNRRVAPDKLQKNCEMPLIVKGARTVDSVNYVVNKKLTTSHNTKIDRTVDSAEINDVAEEEKSKAGPLLFSSSATLFCNSTKKQKIKKKKSKSKEISKDSVETPADAIHVPEKKPKSKKESKPKETKKSSDLFGDSNNSNSLVTPEDLGIPLYVPISEDAQDAVDMKINQIIDAAPLIYKDEIPSDTQTQNRVEVKEKVTKADDIPKAVLQISNTDVEDKEDVNEIKNNKSSKRDEEIIIDPNQLPSPIVYDSLNPETDLNDPNVVKTVIISTGKQPETAYENKIELTKSATDVEVNAIRNTKDIHPILATKECKRDILKALATSTPQKEFSSVNPLQADAAKTTIHDSCVSKAVATITNIEQVINQNEKNTLESNDAPDVRIFVKRRRKVVKRPPMT